MMDRTVEEQVLCGLPQTSLLPKHLSHPGVLLALAPNSGHWSWHFGPVGKGQHPNSGPMTTARAAPLCSIKGGGPKRYLLPGSLEDQPSPGVSFLPFLDYFLYPIFSYFGGLLQTYNSIIFSVYLRVVHQWILISEGGHRSNPPWILTDDCNILPLIV